MRLLYIIPVLPILLLAACQPNPAATTEGDPTAEPTIEVTAEPTETPAPLPNYTPIDLESIYSMTGRIVQIDPASLPTVTDPVFVNHDAPAITFDRTSLEAAGCTFDEFDGVTCPPDSPIASLPCSSVSLPGDLLGALSGEVTLVARCQQIATDLDAQTAGVYQSGCMLLQQNTYLVEFQGYIVQIGSAEAFRTNFAPIEDADEALSYSLALTGLSARYDVAPTDGFSYFTDHIEDTYVQQIEDSYLVHLWHQEICGCSPFMTSQVDVLVHPDGTLDWLGAIPTWLDDTKQICVD